MGPNAFKLMKRKKIYIYHSDQTASRSKCCSAIVPEKPPVSAICWLLGIFIEIQSHHRKRTSAEQEAVGVWERRMQTWKRIYYPWTSTWRRCIFQERPAGEKDSTFLRSIQRPSIFIPVRQIKLHHGNPCTCGWVNAARTRMLHQYSEYF